ncbi:MAG: hydrogenase nickel incorporation protein HypB [Burkholderiales bacterium]|nr:MAG: hydrogenase nickel incorporation protein HypB [Burkholderiales bacterium]
MCTTCGCGSGQTKIEGEHGQTHVHADGTIHSHPHAHGHGGEGHDHAHPGHHHHGHQHVHSHEHVHADGTRHVHEHDHAHDPGHEHAHEHADGGPAHSHAAGLTPAQMVRIERDILGANDEIAARNRRRFEDAGVFALNLVSSPGAGKTTLLVETIRALAAELPLAVIEGDQQTSFDADRIRATGARAIQVNTGKGCHLDAAQVERALAQLAPAEESVLFIENVGNLVCPSAFDLGEAMKVVVLSVTEGEDKPLKYPDMFAASALLLLNKVDLLPHVSFDVKRTIEYARRVRPGIEVLQVSATTGTGMAAWLDWVREGSRRARERRQQTVAALRRRVAELEARVAQQR